MTTLTRLCLASSVTCSHRELSRRSACPLLLVQLIIGEGVNADVVQVETLLDTQRETFPFDTEL